MIIKIFFSSQRFSNLIIFSSFFLYLSHDSINPESFRIHTHTRQDNRVMRGELKAAETHSRPAGDVVCFSFPVT